MLVCLWVYLFHRRSRGSRIRPSGSPGLDLPFFLTMLRDPNPILYLTWTHHHPQIPSTYYVARIHQPKNAASWAFKSPNDETWSPTDKDTAVHSKRCRLLLLIVAESWRASVALAKLKTDNHNNLIGMITENQKLLSFSLWHESSSSCYALRFVVSLGFENCNGSVFVSMLA